MKSFSVKAVLMDQRNVRRTLSEVVEGNSAEEAVEQVVAAAKKKWEPLRFVLENSSVHLFEEDDEPEVDPHFVVWESNIIERFDCYEDAQQECMSSEARGIKSHLYNFLEDALRDSLRWCGFEFLRSPLPPSIVYSSDKELVFSIHKDNCAVRGHTESSCPEEVFLDILQLPGEEDKVLNLAVSFEQLSETLRKCLRVEGEEQKGKKRRLVVDLNQISILALELGEKAERMKKIVESL